MLQRGRQFLLTSGGRVITIARQHRPWRREGNYLDRENTCEPSGDCLPAFLNGRGDCLISSAIW
ncbi:MAG TPA: hypothetical protein DEF84_07040 [Leclercia adecarboxylata]|nr:hypothetical protein [Leclercia adecarboxylata]HCQ07691.1 hypothetical protein [Leclercia adecarboxylata]